MIWAEEFVQSREAGLGKVALSALDKCSDVNGYKEILCVGNSWGEHCQWRQFIGTMCWDTYLFGSCVFLRPFFVAVD